MALFSENSLIISEIKILTFEKMHKYSAFYAKADRRATADLETAKDILRGKRKKKLQKKTG